MADLLDELLDSVSVQAAPAAASASAPKPAAPKPAPKAAPKPKAQDEPTEESSAIAGGKFTLSSMRDHILKKGMWAGALTRVAIPDLQGAVVVAAAADAAAADAADAASETASDAASETAAEPLAVVDIERPHTPALLKIFDEIIVNATDHAKEHEKKAASQRVTLIDIRFDRATGRFSVLNDGPGVPVVRHEEASAAAGRDVYVPEVAFSYFLAGTNIDKDLANVKGGINGLGAKIANVHSVEFNVETVDGGTRRFYSQQWRNRLAERGAPRVVNLRDPNHGVAQAKPHTLVSFVPAYAELGYGPALGAQDAADLDAWIRLRAHQTAAYVSAAVAYNGERCRTTDVAALGRLLLTGEGADAIVLTGQAKAAAEPYKQHPWDVAVLVLPAGKKAGRRAAAQNTTIVNGVLSNKGSHVKYIKGLLSAAVEEKVKKITKKGADSKMGVGETLAGVRLVMAGAIPGADWGGQRKDELQVGKEVLERYTFADAFLKRVADAVTEQILVGQGAKNTKIVHDKYTRAKHAGKAQKANTYLMAAEGDSAISLLRNGLTQSRKAAGPGSPTLDWCGMISLQGVVVNAAREVKEVETSGGETIHVRSAKLQNNDRLLKLADAFGLRYDRAYATPEELDTLHYGKLLLCVDQDLDGTGKIAALVLVWIYTFWPNLIRAGRVGRFMTPVVRVYPKARGGAPLEFYYEEEVREWLEANPGWEAAYHKPKYYKGLAAHDPGEEVKRMFAPEAFRKSIYVYTMDDVAKRLFEVYFGADAGLRKEVLARPVPRLSPEEVRRLRESREIPVGRVQLGIDTDLCKRDTFKRQVPGVDGLNPARRKILAGVLRRFSQESSAKELKVFQLGGYVASEMFYHHGDDSLNKTIVYMAQAHFGARKYPYLIGVGQFGSRHGDLAGSPRYIGVKPSPLAGAVFPRADRWLLPYVFEEGERAEPSWFAPVVPMATLESYRIVSEGWNHESHGRDLDATLAVVAAYIGGDEELHRAAERLRAEGPTPAALAEVAACAKKWPLPPCTRGFAGEVRPYNGAPHSFGVYAWDAAARQLTITELPMGVTTASYLETLQKPGRTGKANPRESLILGVENRSSADAVELVVTLREGAYERILAEFGTPEIDPIEDALMLRASLRPRLNYYGVDGRILEFGEEYLATVLYWAPLRRDMYLERLRREEALAELRVLEETEVVRYIGLAAELNLSAVPDDDRASAALAARGFPRLDRGLLHRPEYTPNADLRRLVTAGPGVSHDYILSLTERDLLKSSVARRQKALAELEAELARVRAVLAERPVPGASVWRSEIERFRATVAAGVASGWKFNQGK